MLNICGNGLHKKNLYGFDQNTLLYLRWNAKGNELCGGCIWYFFSSCQAAIDHEKLALRITAIADIVRNIENSMTKHLKGLKVIINDGEIISRLSQRFPCKLATWITILNRARMS